MALFHYFESITNTKGDALTGFYVKAVNASSGLAETIYADTSLTPIISVSGLANAAQVDGDGNVSFYTTNSTNHIDIYQPDGTTFVRRISNASMGGELFFAVPPGAIVTGYGAVADCTAPGVGTDNHAAFQAAINALGMHGTLQIPAGHYRLSAPLTYTSGIKIIGEGFSENPGTINGVSYPAPTNYQGTVLVFDQNVAGLQFIDFTDNLANATAFEFQGSRYGVLEDLMLYGGGGTTVTAHGIDIRTAVRCRNVRVDNFAGNGWNIAGYTTGANPYGTPNQSSFTNCIARSNGCHGFYTAGTDSNAMKFDTCDASLNGGVGFLEKSLIGNTYTACHAATNNASMSVTTGNTTSASPTVVVASATGIAVGSTVAGSGIPALTTVSAIAGTTITLSANATATATGVTLSFGAVTAQRTKVVSDWSGLSDYAAGSYVTSNAGGAENVFIGCYTEGGGGHKGEITVPSIVLGGLLSEVGARTAAWTAEVWQGSSGGLTLGQVTLREVGVGGVSTPAANSQTLFIDAADHKLKRKDSAGTVTIIA